MVIFVFAPNEMPLRCIWGAKQMISNEIKESTMETIVIDNEDNVF
jgi:hypothetical protein